MGVMQSYTKTENLHCPLLDLLLARDVKGGQFADGSQKDGILKYEKGRIVGVYDPEKKDYVAVDELRVKGDAFIGAMPDVKPWKTVVGNPAKEEILKAYFKEVKNTSGKGAALTIAYAKKSREIGLHLVETHVALNEKDVNTVLLTGFYHAYGPVNDYLL
jgi:hypothetical protein